MICIFLDFTYYDHSSRFQTPAHLPLAAETFTVAFDGTPCTVNLPHFRHWDHCHLSRDSHLDVRLVRDRDAACLTH